MTLLIKGSKIKTFLSLTDQREHSLPRENTDEQALRLETSKGTSDRPLFR